MALAHNGLMFQNERNDNINFVLSVIQTKMLMLT